MRNNQITKPNTYIHTIKKKVSHDQNEKNDDKIKRQFSAILFQCSQQMFIHSFIHYSHRQTYTRTLSNEEDFKSIYHQRCKPV